MPEYVSKGLRINCGSGQRKFTGDWINVDCQEKWKPDVLASGECMPMFADGSADYIVLHHVLEHFGCGEAKPLLTECHRILSQFGSLLVFVPDMWKLANMWRDGRLTTQIYMTNVYGAYMGDEADRHKFGFSRSSLTAELRSCGFSSIFQFDHRSIAGADIAQADWILGVEAIK